MRGVRGRYDPFMMGLVEGLIHAGMVKTTMDPVDSKVGEEYKKRKLQIIVGGKWGVRERVVYFRVPAHLEEEADRGEYRHAGHRGHSLLDLEPDLIF